MTIFWLCAAHVLLAQWFTNTQTKNDYDFLPFLPSITEGQSIHPLAHNRLYTAVEGWSSTAPGKMCIFCSWTSTRRHYYYNWQSSTSSKCNHIKTCSKRRRRRRRLWRWLTFWKHDGSSQGCCLSWQWRWHGDKSGHQQQPDTDVDTDLNYLQRFRTGGQMVQQQVHRQPNACHCNCNCMSSISLPLSSSYMLLSSMQNYHWSTSLSLSLSLSHMHTSFINGKSYLQVFSISILQFLDWIFTIDDEDACCLVSARSGVCILASPWI